MSNKSFGKFLIIWSGEFISNIGSGLTAFALGVYVYQLTGTATSVALVTLFAFLPSVLLSPIAGVLADRFDRRLLMMLGDTGSALGLLFMLLVLLTTGQIAFWQICVGVSLSSIFGALLEPAYKATVTDLLTEEQFSKASGLVQLAGSAKYLLSPFIAGFLLSITSIQNVLIIDILTSIVPILAVFFVSKTLKKIKKAAESFDLKKDFSEGWNAIATNRGVLLLIMLISMTTFFIGFVETLYTPMILAIADTKTLGAIESISATGLLISSLIIGMFSIIKNNRKALVLGLGFLGLFVALLGVTTNITFIVISGFLLFAALPFVNTSADVLIRKNIPNEKQGRVWGLIAILSQVGFIVAYGISGVLADYIFNPLLIEGGALAPTIGRVIGVGMGRGIGLLLIVAGLFVIIMAVIISRAKSISALEKIK